MLFVFLPDSAYEKLMRYEKYGMIALLILVWLGVGDNVLNTAIYNVYAAMINFVSAASFKRRSAPDSAESAQNSRSERNH